MEALTILLSIAAAVLAGFNLIQRRRITRLTERPPQVVLSDSGRTDPVRLAVQQAPLGIVIVDKGGRRVFENEASRVYGTSGDEAVISLRLRNLLLEARDSIGPLDREVRLHGPVPRVIRLSVIPLFNEAVRIGTAAFIEDDTTRSQVESMRSDFIANASHELKTPLGAMRLLAEAMVATNDPNVMEDLADKIQAEAERINRLIDEILDLAILESAPLETRIVDLCDVVGAAMMQTRTFAEVVGIPVQTRCEPTAVPGDRRRLVGAVANLVENALAYTAVKGIERPEPIEVRVDHEGAVAVIEVEDHGIGIAERHQERIFERFYRVDRGRSRFTGGTGLGLAIVRHVVENHKGSISVRSVPGEGTTFRIELPVIED